jgi:L-lactate dehydrogenase complex protein LldG
MDPAREAILSKVQEALGRAQGSAVPPVPATARVGPRLPGPAAAEIDQLLGEIEKLSGKTRRLAGPEALRDALADLVRIEAVKRATCWTTPDLRAWGVAPILQSLGVELIPPQADKRLVASCELGVTGADAALPETGTLALTSSPEQPRVVSLLPRVHLALVRPAAIRVDLHQVFAEAKAAGYLVLVTGPSRTADIELTLTLGVHGPKSLYVWLMEQG